MNIKASEICKIPKKALLKYMYFSYEAAEE
jgi:hypothetical protein